MRIGKVIGTVTSNQLHSSLTGGQFKIVVPFSFKDLVADDEGNELSTENLSTDAMKRLFQGKTPSCSGTEVVVYDELSAGLGEWVAFSEGAEASMAFYPDNKPIDAYAAAIIDTIEIDRRVLTEHGIDL